MFDEDYESSNQEVSGVGSRFTPPQEKTLVIDTSVEMLGRVRDDDNIYDSVEKRLGRKLSDEEKSTILVAAKTDCPIGITNGFVSVISEKPRNGVYTPYVDEEFMEVPDSLLEELFPWEKERYESKYERNSIEAPESTEERTEMEDRENKWSGIFDDIPENFDSSTAENTSGSSKK